MYPGDKVICIDASIEPHKAEEIAKDFEIWVEQDKQYTIRELLDNNGIVTGVLLEEIYNIPKYMHIIDRVQEPDFADWRFRKLNYASSSAAMEQEVDEFKIIE